MYNRYIHTACELWDAWKKKKREMKASIVTCSYGNMIITYVDYRGLILLKHKKITTSN